jgi:hypothetical protein
MIHSFSFFPCLLLCSNNSSSSATTTTATINYKMIKSTQSIRIASFFPFFSLSDDRARAVKPSFVYIYRMYMCFLAFIRNDWPHRSFQYPRADIFSFNTRVIVYWHSKKNNKSMLFFKTFSRLKFYLFRLIDEQQLIQWQLWVGDNRH